MPATSDRQKRFFQLVLAYKLGRVKQVSDRVREAADSMTEDQIRHYLVVKTAAALSAQDRKSLPDTVFGLPEERKYPLTDAKHVAQAERYFNACPPSKRKRLAAAIQARKRELGIDKSAKLQDVLEYRQYQKSFDPKEQQYLDHVYTLMSRAPRQNVEGVLKHIAENAANLQGKQRAMAATIAGIARNTHEAPLGSAFRSLSFLR